MDETRESKIWTVGKQDANVCIYVTLHPQGGRFIASADSDHLSKSQMEKALKVVYPNWTITTRSDKMGYIFADGRAPQATEVRQ